MTLETDPIPISNRRRWFLLFLPAIVSTVGLIVLFLFQRQMTPTWQIEMERYQSMQAAQGNTFEVLSVVTALLPGEFGTREPFRAPGEVNAPQVPPSEVRCVEARSTADGARIIFLLVSHEETSSADGWQVYESAGSTEQINRTLAEIGCFLPSFE